MYCNCKEGGNSTAIVCTVIVVVKTHSREADDVGDCSVCIVVVAGVWLSYVS